MGLGYWSGMPEKDSGQRAEVVAPTVITNVVTNTLREVLTNTVAAASQPTPTPAPPNTVTADAINLIVEKAIREELKKPTGELTEEDLEKVTRLNLNGTKVTDVSLKEVAKLQNLAGLWLSSTQITDAGLKDVAKLQKLKILALAATKVTKEGAAELKKALPNCTIYGPQSSP